MQCPKCETEMVEQEKHSYSYNECPDCLGLWMRHRSLRTVIKQLDPEAVQALPKPFELGVPSPENSTSFDTNDITECPVDGHKYVERDFGGVNIDMCLECDGIWLDAGELTKIREALKDGDVPHTFIGSIAHNIAAYLSRLT